MEKQLNKLTKSKQKYMDIFDNDIITIEELKDKTLELNKNIDKIKEQIKYTELNISKADLLYNGISETFEDIEKFLSESIINNDMLNRIIEKIVVSKDGKKNIYLRLFDDIGLDETVHMQTTVHKDVSQRLKYINPKLYKEVKSILELNKSQRHIRGGLATKKKYINLKNSKFEK